MEDVSLEAIVITRELDRRPRRLRDHEAENDALAALAACLAEFPEASYQKVAETALALCRAHSAGVHLLEERDGRQVFRWGAIAGEMSEPAGDVCPRELSPSGLVLDRNASQLFSRPERLFHFLQRPASPIFEALLVPFYVDGVASGTLWAIAHNEERRFDREDERTLVTLGKFAAASCRISRFRRVAEDAQSERSRTEETLRRRTERIQLLSETLARLFFAQNPKRIVGELFAKVAAHLGTDTYFNFMVSPQGDALDLHAYAGISEESARSISRLRLGNASGGTVAETGAPIAAADMRHSGDEPAALARDLGLRICASYPLSAEGKLLGTVWFASRTRPAFDPDELEFIDAIARYTAVALDRVRTAKALRESENRYRSIVETAPVSILEQDFTAVHESLNRLRAQGITDVGAFLDANPAALLDLLQKIRIIEANDQSLLTFSAHSKNEILASLGELTTPEALQAFRDEIVAFAEAKRHFKCETRLRTLTGETKEFLFTTSFPAEDSPPGRVLACLVDITERKRAEDALRRSEEKLREQAQELEQQLIVSGRLVSLGQITASMAHEFNNPLGIIMGFVEDMLSTSGPDDPNYRSLKIIEEETRRCARIVKDLMEYARPRTADFCSTHVDEVIDKTLGLVENHLYKQKIALRKELSPSLPKIYADPQQLEQVLVNLFLNAIDAMPTGGRLTVRTAAEPDFLVIHVVDTGHGIDPANLTHIFQPFYTAKKRRGLGLGLPICDRIVKNHGGRIEVDSLPGTGTAFRVYLPLDPRRDTNQRFVPSLQDR